MSLNFDNTLVLQCGCRNDIVLFAFVNLDMDGSLDTAESMDTVIEELWKTMKKTCPTLMTEWCTCVGDENAARSEIIQTLLTSRDAWKERSQNFLLRLVSDDENRYSDSSGQYRPKPRVQLALEFVRHMSGTPEFADFIRKTLDVRRHHEELTFHPDTHVTSEPKLGMELQVVHHHQVGNAELDDEKKRQIGKKVNGILHEAAKSGRSEDLRDFLSEMNVNVPNNIGETALHLAAEFEHPEDVKMLLAAGAIIQV